MMARSEAKPKWKLVEEMIQDFIVKRGLSEGDKLPSDQEFLDIFTGDNKKPEYRQFRNLGLDGLSKQPLIRALDELARKGIVVRRAGAPTTFRSLTPRLYDQEFSYEDFDREQSPEQEGFGFGHTSRVVYGREYTNRLVEKSLRPPFKDGDLAAVELKAHKALGLRRENAFLVISRIRILDGRPRAIHRSYLNPGHFPETFLVDHDFEKESLIKIYNASGYRVDHRDTTLRARFPTNQEQSLLKLGREPVLEAEQETHATHLASGTSRLIEHLQAIYVEWEYRISSRRPAETAPSRS
jgi:DNA-binding GntR family transcriptional regulator